MDHKVRRIVGIAAVLGAVITSTGTAAYAGSATSLDRCVAAIASDVLRYTEKAGKCLQKCEDAKRQGTLAADVRCSRPSTDTTTQSCFLTALEGLVGSKSNALKRCADDEVALFYSGSDTCPGENEHLEDLLKCLAKRSEKAVTSVGKKIYHPTREVPSVCGDGIIGPAESCDPNAYPTGCTYPYDVCNPDSCYCTYRGCGNGILEYGEDCDYGAYPTGCSSDQYCNSACECRAYGSASQAFLTDTASCLFQ